MGYKKNTEPITIPDDVATLAYIAGIIDGEGHVGIARNTSGKAGKKRKTVCHTIRLTVSNTDARLLLWFQKILAGGSAYGFDYKTRMSKEHKECWQFHIAGNNCERLLIAVLPYLIVKKEQALLCLGLRKVGEYRQGHTPSQNVVDIREKICQRVNTLNKTGVV